MITCPPSITNACGASGVVTYANPTVTGGTLKSCVPASGSTFAPGTTAVLCTATNACSTNTCTFTVTVRPVPVAVITPPNLTVCAGQNATFTASGGGSYSWSGPGGFTATTAAITRTSVTLAMAGTYTVIVTSAEGCTNSATATLTVVGLLPDGTCPQSSVNKDFTNSTGHTVDGIEWLVQGVYTSVNWHYDGPYPGQPNSTFSSFAIVPSGPNTLFRWSGTASIPSGGVAHVGFCVLGTSITTLSVAWTLGGVPTNCVHQVSIGQGHSHASGYVVFQNTVTNCESVVLYAGNLRLEWYSNSVPLAQLNGFSVRSNLMRADVISASPISLAPGASGFTAIPTPPPGARFAVIQVTVGDGPTLATPGNSIDFFELDAPTNMPPLIIQQPRSQTNTLGSNVTFTVTASGGPPLGYQWRFNGVNIPGATGSIYTIINAQTNNSGNYDVLITNVSGSLISPAATLTLQAAGTGPADLWIRDDVSDVGNEPNLQTTYFWISDDIWVRRLRDPNYDPHPFLTASPTWTPLPHEDSCYRDPKSSSPNYIYVRIRNRGGQPSSGTETLHVYWAKASTGLSWGTGVAGNSDWIDHMETPACSVTPRLYGYEVTKPRKSGATATAQEKSDYVAAIQAINTTTYMFNDPAIVDGNSTGNGGGFIDPVTYFNKQNEIHYNLFNAGIHNSLRFLPWHREEMSRYEILLREFNPTLTLLYWDWTTDPSVTGPIVGPSGYMGAYNPPSVQTRNFAATLEE